MTGMGRDCWTDLAVNEDVASFSSSQALATMTTRKIFIIT
jgi:hypothetical protein